MYRCMQTDTPTPTHTCVHTSGLMIMASHRTFSGQNKHHLAKSNLARQIYHTLSMEISLSLLKIMNARTNFGAYHKYCTCVHTYAHTHIHTRTYACTCTHSHTCMHTHTCTRTHTHPHAHTDTHTHTDTQTHTCICSQLSSVINFKGLALAITLSDGEIGIFIPILI